MVKASTLTRHMFSALIVPCRLSNLGLKGESATTRIALPTLKPPFDGLRAVLHVPPLVYLHQPFTLELVITNRHPTRTACPSISVEPESSSSSSGPSQPATDSFVIAGMRAGRLPVLIPSAETRASWRLIPLETGTAVRLPNIKVRDLRTIVSAPQREREQAQVQQSEAPSDKDNGGTNAGPGTVVDVGDEIPIIDGRWDRRREDGSDAFALQHTFTNEGGAKAKSGQFTIIVSPV